MPRRSDAARPALFRRCQTATLQSAISTPTVASRYFSLARASRMSA